MSDSVKKRMSRLVEDLNRHNHLYYAGTPEIGDVEFDRMLRELIDLETAHPEFACSGLSHPARRRRSHRRVSDGRTCRPDDEHR